MSGTGREGTRFTDNRRSYKITLYISLHVSLHFSVLSNILVATDNKLRHERHAIYIISGEITELWKQKSGCERGWLQVLDHLYRLQRPLGFVTDESRPRVQKQNF